MSCTRRAAPAPSGGPRCRQSPRRRRCWPWSEATKATGGLTHLAYTVVVRVWGLRICSRPAHLPCACRQGSQRGWGLKAQRQHMCMHTLPPLWGQQTSGSPEVAKGTEMLVLPCSVTLSPAQQAPLGARVRDTLQRVSSRSAKGVAGDDAELSAHGGRHTADTHATTHAACTTQTCQMLLHTCW